MITPSDIDVFAELIARETDDDIRISHVLIFADMVEDSGNPEDAGLIRHFVSVGDDPSRIIEWYYTHTLGCAHYAQLIARETNRDARVSYARVFADMVDGAALHESAHQIRCALDAGEEPREILWRHYRHRLRQCTPWPEFPPDANFENGLCVSVSFKKRAVRSLDVLREMPYVQHLDISGTSLRDKDLSCLDYMIGLESFIADSSRIGDKTIERLSRLPRLSRLSIADTLVTSASADALARMNLRWLSWCPLSMTWPPRYDNISL